MTKTVAFCCVVLMVLPLQAAGAAELLLKGNYVQGGLIRGQAPPGSRITLDGQEIRLASNGKFFIGFDRDNAERALLGVIFPDGRPEARDLAIAKREYDVQRIDGLPPAQVTPRTPEQIAKIKADRELKRNARRRGKEGSWFAGDFLWPVKGPVTGVYGSQRILNGEPRRPHYGIDIAAPKGTDVIAPVGGIVTLAEADMYFEGGLIFIDHGLGLVSAFLHLSRIDVKTGDVVEQGQVIGGVGSTGRSTGAHLDWRISWKGRNIDPSLLTEEVDEAR